MTFNTSFIDDQEKMIDFFISTKGEFLSFYSYLTDEEYEATKKEVLERIGCADVEVINGIDIGRIIQSIMMTEWLQNKKEN